MYFEASVSCILIYPDFCFALFYVYYLLIAIMLIMLLIYMYLKIVCIEVYLLRDNTMINTLKHLPFRKEILLL